MWLTPDWYWTSSKWGGWIRVKPENNMHNAAFRLACRSPHCCFDDDICTTAQAPLAAEGWPSGKQRLANRSITLPLCPLRQIADGWILFNSGVMRPKAKAAWLLRAATLKQQVMITRRSSKAASGKLVWNQHKVHLSQLIPPSSVHDCKLALMSMYILLDILSIHTTTFVNLISLKVYTWAQKKCTHMHMYMHTQQLQDLSAISAS